MRIALALMGAVATLAVAAPGLAAEKSKCFEVSEVKGHTIADDHTLYLKVGGASIYRLAMSNNCLGGMKPGDPVTVKARSTPKICEAEDLDVHAEVNGGGLSSRCILDTLTRLTPAEASALPAKLKP